MNNRFCSSPFLIWTVRETVCTDTEWLGLKRYFFVLWSSLLHSNFVLKRSLSWLSSCFFVSGESSLSFTFLLLFLAISLPSYPSVKVHSFPPTRFAIDISTETIWQLWFSFCSGVAMCLFLMWYSFIISSIRFHRKVCFLHLFWWCVLLQRNSLRVSDWSITCYS